VGETVHEINIKIWRNEQDKNWTVEVNGTRFEGVTMEQIKALFYDALLDAEECLVARAKRHLH
jgi:hypothetical protein